MRFIYCHLAACYLSPDERSDTLDFPLEEELGLAGLELHNALWLLCGSNAALFEWLRR